MLLTAIGYGLVAMLASGVSNALLKDATRAFGVLPSVIFRSGVSLLTLLALFAIFRPVIEFSTGGILFAIAISIVGYFPFMLFVTGLERGKVGVLVPISSSWIVIAALVGFLFLGETFSVLKAGILGLVLLGVFLCSVNLKEWRSFNLFSFKEGVPFALMAALLWGIIFPLFKIPSQEFGALFFALLIETVVCTMGCIHLLATKGKLPVISTIRKNWIPVSVAGVLTAFFTLSVSQGYLTGEISIVSALAGAGIVVALITARILHNERLSLAQYAGAGFVLFGTVLASVV